MGYGDDYLLRQSQNLSVKSEGCEFRIYAVRLGVYGLVSG